ncbi:hypothetical protein [Pyxidicoccus xibeiensis]|uniref:hypothetical protein n=1 Tax=Pyxidicoccus xibeiensis TaxID=2906759 RepID=UPI0020A8343F|nr:hypothetical protein [Pyxidicoccus xibeiensis]MCP3144480.1 hypothetical protein [Pyxidicoccus xibeiensis]
MRRWSLALIFSLASPALAQAPATPEAAAPTTQEAAPTTPEAAAPTPAPSEPTPPPAPSPAPESPAPAAPKPPPARRSRQPATPAPAPATPAPTAPATPAPAAPAPPTTGQPDIVRPPPPRDETAPMTAEERTKEDIREAARYLFQTLLTGDVRSTANELFYPFQLEDKRYATPEELVVAWVKQLRLKRTDLITLYDVEVMTLAELEKKYGKAPARLGLDLRNMTDLWAAVGNLSGRPGIFLFRPYRDEHRAFAYTD